MVHPNRKLSPKNRKGMVAGSDEKETLGEPKLPFELCHCQEVPGWGWEWGRGWGDV